MRAVDADELVEYLQYVTVTDGVTFETGFKQILNDIKNAPTIEPKQEWISVKDRLPEKGKRVLVYWDDGFDIGGYVGGEVGDDVYWMPLPEPPETE